MNRSSSHGLKHAFLGGRNPHNFPNMAGNLQFEKFSANPKADFLHFSIWTTPNQSTTNLMYVKQKLL